MSSPSAGGIYSSHAGPPSQPWHLSSFNKTGSFDLEYASYQSPAVSGQIELAYPNRGFGKIRWQKMPCPGYVMGIESVLATGPRERSSEWDLNEVYARGNDLVADYRNREDGRLTRQTIWSIRTWAGSTGRSQSDTPPDMPLIDTIISLQTESLQSVIEVHIVSQLECEEMHWIDTSDQNRPARQLRASHEMAAQTFDRPGCVVYRLGTNSGGEDSGRNNRLSYAEMACEDKFFRWQGEPITAPGSADTGSANRGWKLHWISHNDHLEKGVIHRLKLRSVLLPRENDLQLARDCYEEMTGESPPLGV